MKKPFDRIVGPEGEWIDENGLSEREEFAFRCLNAAANLYGVVTMAEMVAVYNHYAAGHGSPVSDPMDEKELLEIAGGLLEKGHSIHITRSTGRFSSPWKPLGLSPITACHSACVTSVSPM